MPIICNPQRFYIDYRNFYDTKDLLFINSLGGIETIRLRGQIDLSGEYLQTNAQKIQTPEYFANGIVSGDNEDLVNSEQENFTADTGFLPLDNLDRLRDLVNASKDKKAFEIINGKLLPINIRSKTIQWFTNKQNLYSASIQWQYAYTNTKYTPAGYITGINSCPAVESFIVTQSGANKLTIAWAMESGYDKLQVDIIAGGATTTQIIEGNNGQKEISFNNPAGPGGSAAITIQGRTVCNDQLSAPDAGPVAYINLNVQGDLQPVAVDDIFSIDAGYSSAVTLKGSVLDNDYDPNGDEISVTPDSGNTSAGGTYNISAAGIVTYTPPSPTFTGTDSFTYEITEAGSGTGSSSATVRIQVAGAPVNNTNVYVKTAGLNPTTSHSGFITKYYNQVYLEFFSDAAGTNPIDVTGVGLVIAVRKIITGRGAGTFINNYNAVSYQMKIYDGETTEKDVLAGTILDTKWTVLTGVGYTPI